MEPTGVDGRAEILGGSELAAQTSTDGVVTYHLNPYASGVVRFNQVLAEHLSVPFLGLFDEAVEGLRRPLFSFKLSEFREEDLDPFAGMLDERDRKHEAYLHDWTDTPLERRMVESAERVWSGNHDITRRIASLNPRTETVWTPGLLMDRRPYQPAEISVFSFGMAHKIQTARFRRLRDLLQRSELSYVLYVSSATHETKSIGDAQSIYDEMNEIFPRGLYFLGNLSDVAVFNQLRTTTFFASFFPDGVRANNTSIAGAMENGAVVITNLDDRSPPHLRHMENVIDIDRCEELPTDPLTLKRISLKAMESGNERSWSALARRMSAPATTPADQLT